MSRIFYFLFFTNLIFFCFPMDLEVTCAQVLPLWHNSSTQVNNELFKGYRRGNTERHINEIAAGRYLL